MKNLLKIAKRTTMGKKPSSKDDILKAVQEGGISGGITGGVVSGIKNSPGVKNRLTGVDSVKNIGVSSAKGAGRGALDAGVGQAITGGEYDDRFLPSYGRNIIGASVTGLGEGAIKAVANKNPYEVMDVWSDRVGQGMLRTAIGKSLKDTGKKAISETKEQQKRNKK